jgi:predicted AAA+ superfamily ATPase
LAIPLKRIDDRASEIHSASTDEWRPFHWRDRNGNEIDIVAENGNLPVEFELRRRFLRATSKAFTPSKKGLQKMELYRLVLYMGDKVPVFADKLLAIPVSRFSSFPI